MPMNQDQTQQIQQQLAQATANKQPLSIHGSGSHQFMLAEFSEAEKIDMRQHTGVIDYQPTELTLKAHSGTAISELIPLLQENHQRLPTDFPQYAEGCTLGGAIAVGHTGSGRPFHGAIRDHVLGATLINGHGELIHCGGQVMKNVAGYDVSRLLCGSRGTLGPILDITLKVLPQPETQVTLVFEKDMASAIQSMNQLAGQPLPVTAAVFYQGQLFIRLQGTESGVRHAQQHIGGDEMHEDRSFWQSIQQQTHAFFTHAEALWRVILPASAAALELQNEHHSLVDWCGGLRWIDSSEISASDRDKIRQMGGYIEAHRGNPPTHPASLMNSLQQKMQHRIKQAFDPENRFNPRLSPGFSESND